MCFIAQISTMVLPSGKVKMKEEPFMKYDQSTVATMSLATATPNLGPIAWNSQKIYLHPWKLTWNTKNHQALKRKIIWTKSPWLWVPAVNFSRCTVIIFNSRWLWKDWKVSIPISLPRSSWGMSWICLKIGILLKGYRWRLKSSYPVEVIIYNVLYIPGGCLGYLPSTVCKTLKNPIILICSMICGYLWSCFLSGKRCASLKRIVDFPNRKNKTCHHQTHQTRDVSIMGVYTWLFFILPHSFYCLSDSISVHF